MLYTEPLKIFLLDSHERTHDNTDRLSAVILSCRQFNALLKTWRQFLAIGLAKFCCDVNFSLLRRGMFCSWRLSFGYEALVVFWPLEINSVFIYCFRTRSTSLWTCAPRRPEPSAKLWPLTNVAWRRLRSCEKCARFPQESLLWRLKNFDNFYVKMSELKYTWYNALKFV